MGVKFRLEDLLCLNNLTLCNFLLINFILCRCRWTSLWFLTMKVRGQFSSPKKLINDSNLTQLMFCIGHGGQKIIVAWVGSLCLFYAKLHLNQDSIWRCWTKNETMKLIYIYTNTLLDKFHNSSQPRWSRLGFHRTRKMEAVCLNQHSNCSADDGWGRTASSRIGL